MQHLEKHPVENQHELMAPALSAATAVFSHLIHESPLAAALNDALEDDFARFANINGVRYPYASVRLYTSDQQLLPNQQFFTMIDVEKKYGKYQVKSVRQCLQLIQEPWDPGVSGGYEHRVFFNAYHGVSGMISQVEGRSPIPFDERGWYTIQARYGYEPDGMLSVKKHSGDYGFTTTVSLSLDYSEENPNLPESLKISFPLESARTSDICPDTILLEYPPLHGNGKGPRVQTIPYDGPSLARLKRMGIVLPKAIELNRYGNYKVSFGFEGKLTCIDDFYIPSRIDISEETTQMLRQAVKPGATVSTLPPGAAKFRSDVNTWRPGSSMV